jgi:hypothetical protein
MSAAAATATYAERWNGHLGKAMRPLSEQDARRRHESGELYTVLLGDADAPFAVLEVRLEADFVGVHFLDEQRRKYLDYLFGRPAAARADGMLFLEQATHRVFDADGQPLAGTLYVFDPSGLVQVEEKDYAKREVERYKLEKDLSANWEPIPEFGNYESIARIERE